MRIPYRRVVLLLVAAVSLTTLLIAVTPRKEAVAATNNTLNFQARLMTNGGGIVADGFYNFQFKLYDVSSGGSALWTESWYDVDGSGGTSGDDYRVRVKNGYLTVNLGSRNAFPSTINWDQELWITMNVGGTAITSTPTYDGEMSPRLKLTGVPYAFRAGQLAKFGGTYTSTLSLASPTGGDQTFTVPDMQAAGSYTLLTTTAANAGYIQNGTAIQTANFSIQSAAAGSVGARIYGAASQTADILQVRGDGVTNALLSVSNIGAVNIQPSSDAVNVLTIKSATGNNMLTVDSSNSRIGIGLSGNNLPSLTYRGLQVQGSLKLSGTTSVIDTFVTPLGASIDTRINIELYNPGAFGQVLALGLPSTAPDTARGIMVADARTVAHQASIGVLSPNESHILGFSWDGSNTTGLVKNTTDYIALNANGLNVLTARNNASVAQVGIGNNASSGYALDVTGDINTSANLRSGGAIRLDNAGALSNISGYSQTSGTFTQIGGAAAFQNASNSTSAFLINNSAGNSLFVADTTNSRIGINLSGTNTPQTAYEGLHMRGSLRLDGISSANLDNFVTPLSTGVGAVINVMSMTYGNFQQGLAIGLNSGSSSSARGISVLDARTGAHDPSIAIHSPDENQKFGLSYDGSNVVALLKNSASTIALQGNGLNILTAVNSSGSARVGIGNDASGGYALDVTGDINSSANFRTGGTIRLDNAGALSNITGYSQSSGNFSQGGSGTFATGTGAVSLNGNTTIATGKNLDLAGGDANIGAAANRSAGRLFSDSFESGNFKLWSTGTTTSGSTTVTADTTTVRNGKHSVKMTNSNGAGTLRTSINGGTTTVARTYVYVSSQTSGDAGLMTLIGGSNYFGLFRQASNGRLAYWNGPTLTASEGSTVLTTGAWHKIELVLTIHNSTGAATVYIDDTAVLTLTNIDTGTTNPDTFRIGDDATGVTHTAYFDDASVDVVRPGNSANLNVNDSLHVAGTSSFGGAMLLQPASNSTTAFQISNAAGTSLMTADTVNSRIGIGLQATAALAVQSAADTDMTAFFQGRTNQSVPTLQIKQGASQSGKALEILTSGNSLVFDIDSFGNLHQTADAAIGGELGVGIAASSGTQVLIDAANGNIGLHVIGNGTEDILQLYNNGTQVSKVTASGAATFQNSTDSTSAFDVKQTSGAGGGTVFGVDTTAGGNISLLGNNSSTLGTWTSTTAMSVNSPNSQTSRVRGGAVAANGYLYHIGGLDSSGGTIDTVQYAKLNADGSVGTWASTTSLPEARKQFQPVVANGYIYVIGGRDNSNNVEGTSFYAKLNRDGTVGSWNTTTALSDGSAAFRFGQGTVSYNGYIYMIAGFDQNVTTTLAVLVAKANPDGTLGAWSTTSAMPEGLSNINGSVVANGYVYVAAGYDGGGEDDISRAKINADGTLGSWTVQAGMLNSFGGGDENFQLFVANGYLYVVGGDFDNRVVAFGLNADGSVTSGTGLTDLPIQAGEIAGAQTNGYFYILGGSSSGDGSGTVRNSVYYVSTPRVRVGGSLDLLAYGGENFAEGRTGGTLSAGNTQIVGTLAVQDTVSLVRNLTVGGDLAVGGWAAFKNQTNSTTAFQIQAAGSATPILNVDTTNARIGIGTAAPAYKLDIAAGTEHGIRITNTNNSQFAIMINNASYGTTNSTGLGIWQETNGVAHIDNNLNSAISILTDGSVGILNTNPQYALDVTGSVATSVGFRGTSGTLLLSAAGVAQNITGYTQTTGNFNASASSGTFQTSTGAVSLHGNTTIATAKSLTVTAGATTLTGLAAGSSTGLTVNAGATSNVGLAINAISSQAADLLVIKDGATATMVKVDAVGALHTSYKPTSNASSGSIMVGDTATQSSNDINGVIGFLGTGVQNAQIAYAVGDGFYLCNSSASSAGGDYGQCSSRVNLYAQNADFNGTFVQSGSGTFQTGTGAVALNGHTTIAGNKSLIFAENGGADTVTLQSGATTASYTMILPTAIGGTGDCLKAGTVSGSTVPLAFGACGTGGGGGSSTFQNAYDNSGTADPQITLTSTFGGIEIVDGTTPVTGNMFSLQNNAGTASYFGVAATGMTLQNSSGVSAMSFENSTNHLKIYNPSDVAEYVDIYYDGTNNEAVFTASSGATRIGGASGNIALNLTQPSDILTATKTGTLSGSNSADTFSFVQNMVAGSNALSGSVLKVESLTSGSNITSNTVAINQQAGGTNLIYATTGGSTERFKVSTAGAITASGGLTLGASSSIASVSGTLDLSSASGNLTLTAGGANKVIIKPGTNSASSFEIQNAGSTSLFAVDTTDNKLQIGSATTNSTAVLLILDSYDQSTDPTGTAGAMYYNTNLSRFRCYEGGAWRNCLGTWYSVAKTSDESRTNNTMADDSTLLFPMAASTEYSIRCTIYFETAATPDFKYQMNGPASPTLVRSWRQHVVAAASTVTTTFDTAALGSTALTGNSAGAGYVKFETIWHNGSNAANWAFQWAQNTTNGTAATVRAGSYCDYAAL